MYLADYFTLFIYTVTKPLILTELPAARHYLEYVNVPDSLT